MSGKKTKSQLGYTLLEMAIVMSVLGLLMAAGTAAYNIYHKNKVERETVQNTSRVINAVSHFLIQNGRYPCPARADVGRGHAEYGMEGDCSITTLSPGNCANGICVEEGERLVNVDPSPGGTTMVLPRVRRGSIPFRVLSISEKESEDGFGLKLNYAVTETLAVASTYRKDAGGISLIDGADATVIDPPSSAHFVIFSAGQDRRGGYNRNGTVGIACAPITAALDALNCDTSTGGSNRDKARYRVSSKATTDSAEHYDDYIRYYASIETPLWRVMGTNGFDIVDMVDVPAGGRIGIGHDSPLAALHVQGDMQADENIEIRDVCDTNGAGDDCFAVNIIAGDEPALQCPAGSYMTGIANGLATCTNTPVAGCPPGKIMSGIDVNGNPVCASVQACASKEVDMCQVAGVMQKAVIPTRLNGATHSTVVYGASFQRHFLCDGGNWVQTSTSGSCSCTPVTNQLQTQDCYVSASGTTQEGDANKTRCRRPECWTGTASRMYSRTCPDGNTTYTAWDRSGCACIGPHQIDRDRTCSDLGYSSYYTPSSGTPAEETSTWTCTSATAGKWSGWVLTAGTDTCSCTPHDEFSSQSCSTYMNNQGKYGPAYSGSVDLIRQVTCGSPATTPWTPNGPVNCTCNAGYIYPSNEPCPSPETGHIEYTQQIDCGTGLLGPKVEQNRFCSSAIYRYVSVGAQSGEGNQLPFRLGMECPAPSVEQKLCSSPCAACAGGYAYYPCQCQ